MSHRGVTGNVVVLINIYIYYYYDSGHSGLTTRFYLGKRKCRRQRPAAFYVGDMWVGFTVRGPWPWSRT